MTVNQELRDALTRHYLSLLPDGLRPAEGGKAEQIVRMVAGMSATEIETAARMMLEWLPQTASAEALDVIGASRGLQRYPGEYLEAWRNRVLNAYQFWEMAGTLPGMLMALEHMGYGVIVNSIDGETVSGVFEQVEGGVRLRQASGGQVTENEVSFVVDGQTYTLPTLSVPDDYQYYGSPPTTIVEHYHDDTAIWAEFSLIVTPTKAAYTAPAWGGGTRWGDGTLWGLSVRASEIDRIRAVIREIKPAHARLRAVYLVSRFSRPVWGSGSHWGDGTHWGVGQPLLLWMREGVT